MDFTFLTTASYCFVYLLRFVHQQAEHPEEKPAEAEKISLIAQLPPIEKMDATLNTFAACT